MKKIMFLLLFICGKFTCNAQCISLADMKLLFHRDMEAQDTYLGSKGFRLGRMPIHKLSWVAKSSLFDANVYIDYDENNLVAEVGLQGASVGSCYEEIKSGILSTEFKKDGESIGEDGQLTLYYSGQAYGIIFSKSVTVSSADGKPYFFAVLTSKSRYAMATSFDKDFKQKRID